MQLIRPVASSIQYQIGYQYWISYTLLDINIYVISDQISILDIISDNDILYRILDTISDRISILDIMLNLISIFDIIYYDRNQYLCNMISYKGYD